MKTLEMIKTVCEIIGGSREPRQESHSESGVHRYTPLLRGIWWGLLAAAIILFCGQTSKFIYIDF